jgi:hypothetical protein
VSISPTFYAQLFLVILAAIFYLKFGFIRFWCKKTGGNFLCQFYQHFKSIFYANVLALKEYKPKSQVQKSCGQNFRTKKDTRKILVKLTAGLRTAAKRTTKNSSQEILSLF